MRIFLVSTCLRKICKIATVEKNDDDTLKSASCHIEDISKFITVGEYGIRTMCHSLETSKFKGCGKVSVIYEKVSVRLV